jgi:hypothetical protein
MVGQLGDLSPGIIGDARLKCSPAIFAASQDFGHLGFGELARRVQPLILISRHQ